jgi:hypothetical protein
VRSVPGELCLQKLMFNAKQTMLNEQVKAKRLQPHFFLGALVFLVAILNHQPGFICIYPFTNG